MLLGVGSYLEDQGSQRLVFAVMKGGFQFPVTIRNEGKRQSELVMKPDAITAEQGKKLMEYFVACVEKTGQVKQSRTSSTPDGGCDCFYSYQALKNGSTVRLMLSQWKPDKRNAFASFNYVHVFRMPTADCPAVDSPSCLLKDGKDVSFEDIAEKKVGVGTLLGTRAGD